jgi:predicted aspartyl protease
MEFIVRGREAPMGRIIVLVTVASLFEPGRQLRFDAVVDTGAYCLTLPAAWKEALGSVPIVENVQAELADRRVVSGELRQPLRIQIDDFPPAAGEVLFVDVTPDEVGGYMPLIGYMTLEQSRVAVDMVAHRLHRIPRVDLKRVLRAA